MRRPRFRSLAGGAAGIAAGVIGGVALTSVSAAGTSPAAVGPALIDATHVPPVLTMRGEPLRLRFGLVCTPRDDGLPCDGSGTVYARAGQTGAFHAYSLERGGKSKDGRYFVDVPLALTESPAGFSYYAVLRDDATGATVIVPSGGADAPQISVPLRNPLPITLGRHLFGATRDSNAIAAKASWGSGPDDVGLAGSRELGLTGPSSFDVEPDGTVDVLDSVNERIVRWHRGRQERIPIGGPLELADFAAEPYGSFDVLDDHATLRRFRGDGSQAWAQKLADRTWAKLGDGAVVLQQPSEQWMSVAQNGVPLTRSQQTRAAHTAHHELLVDRVGERELRIAQLGGNVQRRAWRILGDTPLGEVQLAEPHGNGVIVVTRAYTDDRDEFIVLVLGSQGLVQRFSVASGSWTETAPLARFRLARASLYRLRTTESGAFVERFELEVPQ